jgi:hypothetical protein
MRAISTRVLANVAILDELAWDPALPGLIEIRKLKLSSN